MVQVIYHLINHLNTVMLLVGRDAGGVGAGGHVPPQVLGYQLTLFGPRGADYARYITTRPPIFLGHAAFL